MKKRILSLILCLAMVLTLLPAAVFAADNKITTITVNVPYDLVNGEPMPFDSNLVTVGDPALYSAYLWSNSWSVADGFYMPDADNPPCFTGGEVYTLTVLVVAKDGATGLDDETAPYIPVYINGERAKFNPACSPELEEAPGKTVYAYMIDLQCPYTNVIKSIDVYGFTPPTPGATPCTIDDLSVPENAPYHIGAAFWVRYKGDPATSGAVNMEEGELFEAGSTYYMNLAIYANDGYTFSTGGDFTWRFNGSAFNGYADETYSYILSPKEAQFYSADLTAEARHIDRIDIENLGGFYQGATVQSAIEKVTAPDAEGYTLVIEPDSCVTRNSDNTYINATDLFVADESYRATFLAYPDPGWTIDGDTVWTINGSTTNVYYAAAGSGYWYVKSEVFPSIKRAELDRIDVYGYIIPQVGQHAGDLLTMYVVGDLYEITDAYWFCDSTSHRMEADETFEAGKTYSACVVVKPTDPAFVIGSTTEFYLNSGYFPMGIHGAKSDGISYYVWTKTMEAAAPDNTHVVSWYLEPDDEYPVTGVEVEDGEVFGLPAEPGKDGYIFGGWYLNRSCTIPYDPTAPIYADTDLFPLWIPASVGTPITAVDAKIPVPVAGQEPAGTASVTLTSTPEGAPLSVSTLTWFYWDDTLPAENKWMVVPASDYVFEAGETYAVDIFARTEEDCGYFFDPAVVGTVNGQPSDEEYDTVYQSATSAYLSYVWTAEDVPITAVSIDGFVTPRAGELPIEADALTVPDGAPYSVSALTWYLAPDPYSGVSFTGLFVEGNTYFASITLTPEEGYAFVNEAENIVLTVNGTVVTDWFPYVDVNGDFSVDTPDLIAEAAPCTHENTEVRDAVEPTCLDDGYSGDIWCLDCGEKVTSGSVIAALGHDFVDGICSRCGAEEPTPADPCEGYTDIDRSSWYHSAADFVIANGYMGSTSTTALTFEPNTKVSRAMVASILYRICGSPAVEYSGKFSDVKEGSWYTKAIEWCAQNGLASGYTDGSFKPNATVSRQELAVFMYKLAEYLGKDVSGRAELDGFADGASVPAWSEKFLQWAVSAGIISGQANGGKNYLKPTDGAKRCEFASVLKRFV